MTFEWVDCEVLIEELKILISIRALVSMISVIGTLQGQPFITCSTLSPCGDRVSGPFPPCVWPARQAVGS